jgi:purine-nucleoside phosphorylase
VPLSHLDAAPGEIAEIVLMPGDPLRGQRIAEEFLEQPRCHNRMRNMLGFTGSYHGTPVSVQASGMGGPSVAVYASELFTRHRVRTIVRVGTCAGLQRRVQLGDLILVMAAASDSQINASWVPGVAYAPAACFPLLAAAERGARSYGHRHHVGQILTTDLLHLLDMEKLAHLVDMGVLGMDMETAVLYGIAARHGGRALSVLTVTDHLHTGDAMPSWQRETGYLAAVTVALDAALASASHALKGSSS